MKIKSVIGPEPLRDQEAPGVFQVGYNGVTRIDEYEQNLGTYSIIWYEVYGEKGRLAKLNALHMAAVEYF